MRIACLTHSYSGTISSNVDTCFLGARFSFSVSSVLVSREVTLPLPALHGNVTRPPLSEVVELAALKDGQMHTEKNCTRKIVPCSG